MKPLLLKGKTVAAILAATMLSVGYAGSASASLIFAGETENTGEGYGNVVNVLSLHNAGGAGNAGDREGGAVAWNGSMDVITQDPAFVLSGANKTATHTFAEIALSGATAASDLRLIWNPSEVGNSPRTDVEELILRIFNPAGTVVFTASLPSTQSHTTIGNPGLGAGDFVYKLDVAQAGILQTTLTGAGNFSQYRIGLEAEISFVDDGPDTWILAKALGTGATCPNGTPLPPGGICNPNGVPEPATTLLIGAGLFGLACMRRRRRV